ncbi:Zinc/iron permease [Apodospora peruviana]|uniref:Zinc/iron permease n=1 Tax=Apodospora peruviana TaxID=516989 RepID=A0AAE0IC31_9PEZI|nr:Zinc/iron permease [Apodospora peruviana]
MLPSSMRFLTKGKWDERQAGFIMMGCFAGGFIGIGIVSRFLHRYMPSHVVDCDHSHLSHQDEGHSEDSHSHHHHLPRRASRTGRRSMRTTSSASATGHVPHMTQVNGGAVETTPLLAGVHVHTELPHGDSAGRIESSGAAKDARIRALTLNRRPSMSQVQKRVMSFVKDTKPNCDEFGPCFGYTDPCGQECFKHIATRSSRPPRQSTLVRINTGASSHPTSAIVDEDEEAGNGSPVASPLYRTSRAQSRESTAARHADDIDPHTHTHAPRTDSGTFEGEFSPILEDAEDMEDLEAQHHHHVPTNAFLSIGLQTVIAIALHKFPEGFITFATNHASPSLGFNVFMALFVHNIAEGFALALPLYMALGSRLKAILWSSLLGGFSQPMGAGFALLWFKIAKSSEITINNTAYAILFAVTAGIMTSVALQLYGESLSLNHNRQLSMLFAFFGMMLLGFSNALVKH